MTLRDLQAKYARIFWTLHTAWALISGVAVLVLAHNRYGFVRWVVLFIALTWGSTLLLERKFVSPLAHGVVSYLTRVMYQETLFFLIPFYFYSSTVRSVNFLYVIALGGFAVLSCFDMLFDRLLREHRGFAIGFFAFVSFSALQFFLPLLLQTHIQYSAYVSAGISLIAAVALARETRPVKLAIATVAVLIGVYLFLPLVPPVPLRLTSLRFSGTLNPATLEAPASFDREIPASALARGRIYAVATFFAPQRVPASMQMQFVQNGNVLRASRKLELIARPGGFRIWDSLKLPDNPASDTYTVEVWTGGQLLGKRTIRVLR